MTVAPDPITTDGDLELLIERVFNAPRDLIYAAWTQKEHLAQ
jgi:uncharacterized protein YndB with AHSA1/START domain